MPILVLGPFGSGAIVIHDHHEEDLHTHKVAAVDIAHDSHASSSDQHSSEECCEDDADLLLVLRDMPRLQRSGLDLCVQVKIVAPLLNVPAVVDSPSMPSAWVDGILAGPMPPHRTCDTLVNLLLSSRSLLI